MNHLHLIAAVLIAEAGGERDYQTAMEAVNEVITERVAWYQPTRRNNVPSFTECKTLVVTQPKQFSCLNRTTPEKLIARAQKHLHWPLAVAIAMRPVTHHTVRATHYHARTVTPSWTKGRKPCARIGNHLFYRL